MIRIRTLMLLWLFSVTIAFGQHTDFRASKVSEAPYSKKLAQEFEQYNLYQMDYASIAQYVQGEDDFFDLNIRFGEEHNWTLSLEPKDIRTPGYLVLAQTENGVQIEPQRENMTFRGYLEDDQGGVAGFTINDHHFAGTVKKSGELFFVEPLWYLVKDAPKDIVVVYSAEDVIPHEGLTCGADKFFNKANSLEHQHHQDHDHDEDHDHPGSESRDGLCLEVELAIASDWLMYLDYNQSTTEVEDHNITVMNNVATNWDDEFADEIVFVIVTQFISTCSTCDPWTASTNAGTLLSSFRSWGQGGGFGIPFDLGQLWTDRDLNGGTIGIAYLNGLCNSLKYHVCQDFTTNQQQLRVLTAHEIGHNFNASHDSPSSNTIMRPSVNTSNAWSSQSVNQINSTVTNRYNSGGCFDECITVQPPIPDFVGDPLSGCIPLQVQFTDVSANVPTEWLWEFPGGTPAFSNEQNPTVTYNAAGVFDVILTATNSAGTNTITKIAYVNAFDVPEVGFTYSVNDDIVVFNNTTVNGLSYFWDFGDGNTSTDFSPIHFYQEDGEYLVTLTATNACGINTITQIVVVATLPEPAFTSNITSGCPPLVVAFEDQSTSNTDFWLWEFPGGDPNQSADQNPIVIYNTPGTYDVTLTVINEVGSNTITIENYITIDPLPTPNFTSSVNGNTVDFTNTSTDATSYSWDFGDGNTSTEENPSHTYDEGGEYIVVLTAINDCGELIFSETITIEALPVAGINADTLFGCAPLTVNFTDVSSGNVTSWEWSFPGGDPDNSTDQNPIVVYNNEGVFDVTLIVTNGVGSDTITEVQYISINDVPDAGFNSSVNDLTVDFTNTSSNADTYSWDFGDGNSSTQENPSHTYDEDGVYTVILTATNECGSVTSEETITIVTAPVAGFSANVTSGCVDLTVQFTDESTANATSWEWTFAGGNPSSSTQQNPTVTYSTAGTYTVILTVSNAAGESTVTETDYIVVNDVPAAGFDSTVDDLTVDFTNTSSNADTYSWDFGDGNSSTEENPSHTYDEDGEYTVILTATNECGSVTSEETITIITAPVAGFSANVTSGCVDFTVQFTDESTANATSWEWTFAGGNPSSSTQQNPTVTYSTAGTYTVILTVSNAAGESTVTETDYIVVNDVPAAGFDSTVDDLTVDFTNTSSNADTYSWDFGDGNSSTEENPSHTYDEDGEYTVILTATNECGSVTSEETITIVTAPVAGFSANVTSGCVDLTVQFTDESTANATSWEWTFAGGNPSSSTQQNPTVTYSAAGTYTVILTVSNAAGESTVTETDYIVVNDVPAAGFSTNVNDATVDFTNTSSNADTYSWDFGDGNSSTEENPSHTYDEDGEYTVILTATNECGSVTSSQVINIGTLPTASFTADVTEGCVDLVVNFTDQSSANTTSWEWTFEGGNPTSSTEQNPEVVYSAPGIYSVTLVASNASGSNTSTQVDYIVVNDVPDPDFTSSSAGAVVSFTNTTTNADTYSWDFGDGNSSTEENPVHTYDTEGDYEVTLTATNECGSNEITQTVTAVVAPVAGFSANVTSGCAPLTVEFSNESSANAETFNWTFEGGNPSSSTEENPVVVYDTPGLYSVSLEVSNAAGSNEVTQTEYIMVNTVPTAGFTGSVTGTSVSFTNTSTGATSFNWDFGDGNGSEDTNPSHDFGVDGTYTVTLTAENECGTVTFTETFEIVTAPLAGFTADVTSGCAPLTVNFIDQSSENTTSWSWTFEGGNPDTSTEQNPTVTYSTPGSYTVTLVASSGGGNDTQTQEQFIVVNTVPVADFSSDVNGSTVDFLNNSTGATSYLWDFGDGNQSSMPNPEHTYDEDGEYTVTLTAINECGEVTTTQTVIVNSLLPNAIFQADVTTGCGPFTVNFTDQSTGNVESWSWNFPGGIPNTSTEQNPVVEYALPGIYSVTLEVTNAVGMDIQTITSYITVEDVPQPDFSATITGATALFTNTSSGGTSYSWDFGDGNGSTEENPFHIYNEDGTYTVVLTVTNSCGSVTSSQDILIVTPPAAMFTFDGTEGCAPFVVQFSDLSSANTVEWEWTFEGGTPSSSNEQNPMVTYNSAGVFDVTLVVTNAAGMSTASEIDLITISDVPAVDFSAMVSGATADFTNLSNGGDTYSWDFGDGNSSTDENQAINTMKRETIL